jgi:phytoene desaturase
MKTIVIGAGFSGLSIAALLAKDGHEVTVLEKNEAAGGRARMLDAGGFRFDMGPSWYMMPEVFERFFQVFGKHPSDYYNLERLDPHYRIFFEDDQTIDISSDMKKNLELFESWEKGSAQKFQSYLEKSKQLYDISMEKFIYRNYESITDMLDPSFKDAGLSLDLVRNLDLYLQKFFKDERIRKILSYTVVFLGGNPKNTPALYALMSHVDFNLGVWYPKGGMNAVARGIEALGKEQGVQFLYNQDVENIITENGHAKGVLVNGDKREADCIVNTGDYHYGEMQMLDEKDRSYRKKYWEKAVMAPSAFILYLGVNKTIPQLTHHNLFLAHDWQEHFEQIFSRPSWPEKASYYLCNPNKTEPGMAPEGKENLFILVPVASGLDDSEQTRKDFRNLVIADLEKQLDFTFADAIEYEKIYAQSDFLHDYYSFKGTALGLAHTLKQSAAFRPRQRSKKVKNLYYSGQYTHPGIGVPMVMIAAENLHQMMRKDYA